LIEKLAGEQGRWYESAKRLDKEINNLLGDIILAVGSMSYLGGFIGEYRKKIIFEHWIPSVKK